MTTTKHPVKVMVFGAVTASGKSKLIFIKGSVDAARYQKVLETVDIAKFLKVGSRKPYQFMEDGAPAHRAKTTQKWLTDHGIQKFPGSMVEMI